MAFKNIEEVKKYRANWFKSKDRPKAKCHPDKPHRARGLCDRCYDLWLYRNSERNRNTKLKNAKIWRDNNYEKSKKSVHIARLKRRYGITESDYNEMFLKQNGKCKICREPEIGRKLHIDHCHKTGKVRGLLCFKCNGRLSWLEQLIKDKRSKWVKNALIYLDYEKDYKIT